MKEIEILLGKTLNKIDDIKDYISLVGSFLFQDMRKVDKNSRDGFLIGVYLDILRKNLDVTNLGNEKVKEIIQLSKELTDKYLDIIKIDEKKNIAVYKNKSKRKKIDIEKDTNSIYKCISRLRIFYNSLLINLIIEFENCMGDIFMYYITKYPEAYLNNENINYTLISSIVNIEDVRLLIKRKHVDKIMHENIKYWLKMLKDKHNIIIDIPDSIMDNFIEAYYRRNLVVHNDLIVNQEYLENIPNIIDKPKLNEKLRINKKYINNVIMSEKKIIIKLLYNIDKKENKDKNFIESLTNYAYKCMQQGDWNISKYVYYLIMKDDRQNEQEKLFAKINYWQSVKRQGEFEKIKEEIEEFDVSACERVYKFAKEILLEDNSNAIKTLRKIYNKDDGISSLELEEWPLFIEFRKTNEYKDFKEKNMEDFQKKEKNEKLDYEVENLIESLDDENKEQ